MRATPGDRLVGRVAEWRVLTSLLEQLTTGRGRAVLLLGEAGIGKTRLTEALAEEAGAAGFAVAWGRTPDAEAPPYWPWARALADLLGRPPDALFEPAGPGARFGMFAAVVDELAQATASRPAVVVLEDVHWADPASLDLLRFVAGALPGFPLLLAATARDVPAELSDVTAAALDRLPSAVLRLPLAGVDRAATAALIEDVAGAPPPPTWVDEVCARTGGNPFFIRELARLGAQQGQVATVVPPGVRQVVSRRLARLSQPAVEVLGAAAVAGDSFTLDAVAAIAGQPEEEVAPLLDGAERARLLHTSGGTWSFAHALVREALYEEQSPSVRAARHRRAAELLTAGRGPGRLPAPGISAQIAAHWARAAGRDARGQAAAWSYRAATMAAAQLGYEQAARYFGWAIEYGYDDRVAATVGLGEAEVLAGRLEAGRATLREAAELAAAEGRYEELAAAALAMGTGLGGFEVDVFDRRQARLLERALAGLPADDSPVRAAVLARYSLALAPEEPPARRQQWAVEAVDMAHRCGDEATEVSATAALCDALAGPDHVEERLVLADRMVQLAERIGNPMLVLLARRLRLVALLERGALAAVDAEIAIYARTAERLRLPLVEWPVFIWRGMRALLDGDAETAWVYSEAADDLGRRAGSHNAHQMVFTLRMAIHRASGRARDVVPLLDEFAGELDLYPGLYIGFAVVHAEAGDADRARPFLRNFLARGIGSLPRDSEWVEMVWLLGEAGMLLDSPEAARLAYDALLPYPDLWAVDGIGGACFGLVGRLLGRLAAFLGDPAAARGWLGEAAARYRAAGVPFQAEAAERDLDALGVLGEAAEPPPSPVSAGQGDFVRTGGVWQVQWRGIEAVVPHTKGMADLARLLAEPDRDVHVLDLVEFAPTATRDTGPALDATARRAYRDRLIDLDDDIATATAAADIGLLERLEAERDFLLAELGRALGLGGRTRSIGDPVERARKAVTRRIGTALRAIEAAHPTLGRHLRLAVATGRFCRYQPEEPTFWNV